MRFKDYIKDRVAFLIINLLGFIALGITLLLVDASLTYVMFIFIIWFLPVISYMIFEYIKVRKYYNDLNEVADNLDQKYLIAEVIKEPTFIEGKVIYRTLRESNKSMNENVKEYKMQISDYKEYIETWVHEIKTPIASSKLVIENNKNDVTSKINQELDKVDEFIEQVLYYSRSEEVSKDYRIKKLELRPIINSVARAKSRDFINKKISLELLDVEQEIYTDEKWLIFIMNQIIQNSIKYSKEEGAKVKISAIKKDTGVELTIEDNGMGISDIDIGRVFEKNFTGENGRIVGKSTGMGLYICSKLCKRLQIGISIESEKDKFTRVKLVLPIGGITNF